jgi:hypothetical protein
MSSPWRYRCPQGHCSVTPRVGSIQDSDSSDKEYYCECCDKIYSNLIDWKTGKVKA